MLRPRTAAVTSAGRKNKAECVHDRRGSGGLYVDPDWEVDSASDRVVFEEKDDAFFADVGKTKDHAFVVINVHSKTTSEVHFMPATLSAHADDVAQSRGDVSDGNSGDSGAVNSGYASTSCCTGPVLLRRRQDGVEYYVDHSGDAFYLVTNSSLSTGGDFSVEGDAASDTGEYRLVRLRQTFGAFSLEGIADAPWEPVSRRVDAWPSNPATTYPNDARGGWHARLSPGGRDANIHKGGPNCREISSAREESGRAGGIVNDGGGSKNSSAAAAAAAAERRGFGGGTIQEMDVFKEHCVLYESSPETGAPFLRVAPLATGSASTSSFVVCPPEPGGPGGWSGSGGGKEQAAVVTGACTLRPGVNSWFEARTARFTVSSPVAPEDVYDLCLESGGLELLRRTEVPGSPSFCGRDYW